MVWETWYLISLIWSIWNKKPTLQAQHDIGNHKIETFGWQHHNTIYINTYTYINTHAGFSWLTRWAQRTIQKWRLCRNSSKSLIMYINLLMLCFVPVCEILIVTLLTESHAEGRMNRYEYNYSGGCALLLYCFIFVVWGGEIASTPKSVPYIFELLIHSRNLKISASATSSQNVIVL